MGVQAMVMGGVSMVQNHIDVLEQRIFELQVVLTKGIDDAEVVDMITAELNDAKIQLDWARIRKGHILEGK